MVKLLLSCLLGTFTAATALAQAPPFRFEEEAATSYRCNIDNDRLVVELALTDRQEQEKILRNGVHLWIDPRGKKAKKTCISYPLPASVNQRLIVAPPHLADSSIRDIAVDAREMKLSGFTEAINGIQNHLHPSGIEMNLCFVNDTLMYKAQLPLNILAATGELSSKIGIGIVINGSDEPTVMLPPEDPMQGNPPPPPGEGPNRRLLEDDEFWCKLVVFRTDEKGITRLNTINK